MPPAKAPCRVRTGGPSRHWASPSSAARALEHSFHGVAHQLLARAVGQLEPLLLVKSEHRDADLLHHRAQQGAGLQCAQALVPQGIAQGVDFMEHFPQRVVPVQDVRADREILFPQGQQQV